jgi:hypothetical protein
MLADFSKSIDIGIDVIYTLNMLTDYDELKRRLVVGEYLAPAPSTIRLENGRLFWQQSSEEAQPIKWWHDIKPSAQTLMDFVNLADESAADDKDVLRFAKRWGTLNLCKDHLTPINTNHVAEFWVNHLGGFLFKRGTDQCRDLESPRLRTGEPVSEYRRWARAARALLTVSGWHEDKKLGSDKDWAPLREWLTDISIESIEKLRIKKNSDAARHTEKALITGFINAWILMGNVRPSVSLIGDSLALGLEVGGTFGALAVQLLENAGGYSIAACTGCRKFFDATPANERERRPKFGQGRYCRACKDAGVPIALAKRRKLLGFSKPRKKR